MPARTAKRKTGPYASATSRRCKHGRGKISSIQTLKIKRKWGKTSSEDEKRALDTALQAVRVRGQSTIAAILNRSDMLPAEDFGALLNISRETVNRRRQERKVLALQGTKRGYRYPAWQLTERGQPLPGLATFLGAVRDDWVAYRWLTERHPELGGLTGIEALTAGRVQDLVELANRFGENFG